MEDCGEVTSVAYCAECVSGMLKLPDNSIDLTVTSPPYDNLRTYNGYTFNWKATLEQLFRVTKPGGVVVWIVADQTKDGSESGTSFRQALYAMECGFKLHDTMIWDKESFVYPCKSRYFGVFEYMFVLSKDKPKSVNMICDRANKSAGKKIHGTQRQPDGSMKIQNGRIVGRRTYEIGRRFNVWHMPPVQSSIERTGHPAQFPLALARDHIISWSKPGDTVLDPFLGSGTTRIAAHELGRSFVGYEIDREYFDLQEKRFAQWAAQTSKKEALLDSQNHRND